MKFKINSEYENLNPPLSISEYESLKQSIKNKGIEDNIKILSNGVIIDGHHRFKIANELNVINIPYKIIEYLKDEYEIKKYIILNNLERRNLTIAQKIEQVLKLEDMEIQKAKERQGTRTDIKENLPESSKGQSRDKLGQLAGCSGKTYEYAKEIIKVNLDLWDKVKSGELSIYNAWKQTKKKEKSIERIDLPEGKYSIIYADPNWNYWDAGIKNQSQHYETLDWEEIRDYEDNDGKKISDLADKNCILFLWITAPMLEHAKEIIESWGFKYSTVGFVWVKSQKDGKGFAFGLGNWTRKNAEYCLIGIKGSIPRQDASISEIIYTPKEEHSKKPDEVRNKIIQLVGDLPRIELFARQKTEGWDMWGNEIIDKE